MERSVYGSGSRIVALHAMRIQRPARDADRRRDTGLELEITDSGRPFNPTTAPEFPLSETIEAAPIGGMGLRLVRSYASEVTYRHDGVCNRLTLHLRTATP